MLGDMVDRLVLQAHRRLSDLSGDRRRYDWGGEEFGVPCARVEQLPPTDDAWLTWLYLGGRGAGKTRAASERVRHWVRAGRSRLGLIAATAADARDVMVEGESGILAVCHEGDTDLYGNLVGVPVYEPSKRRLTWLNGAVATLYSSETPQRLRGPQHEGIWADELCAWKNPREVWDMAQFGLRLGAHPQTIITTTPKPLGLLREIIADKTTVVTRGSTFENSANLSRSFLSQVRRKYEGTALGRQELYAKILDEIEGALWKMIWLDDNRVLDAPDMSTICISIDPAVTANEDSSNETGLVVCGVSEGHGYVIEDCSGVYSPYGWARAALDAYHRHSADYILAEVNNGGDLVVQNIRNVDDSISIRTVFARKGKYLRAEPVAALYEQGRVSHVGSFEKLEDQMVCWEPLGRYPSPDRLDALVHGMTSLMVKNAPIGEDYVAAPIGLKTESVLGQFE